MLQKFCKVSCFAAGSRTLFGLFGHYHKDKYNNISDKSLVPFHQETAIEPLPTLVGKPRLTELSLKGIAEYINTAQCQNILVLVGHNAAAAAGIPNYKKVGGIEARKLIGEKSFDGKKEAELLFHRTLFIPSPYAMFRFVQSLWPGNHRPTFSHYFLRMLQEKGSLLRVWTENIDNLEKLCGIREEKLVESNGSFLTWRCLNPKCNRDYDLFWLKEKLELYQFPNCDVCNEKTCPRIIWLEESTNPLFRQASVDAENCDLVIVLGSDMLMNPFCKIPHWVPWDVPRLVINQNLIENDTEIQDMSVLFDFDSDAAYRDVFWNGPTDLGVLSLCSYLGWDKDVRYIMEHDTALLPTRKDMQQRLGLIRPNEKEFDLTKFI